jgi:hypothetical protein
MELVQMSSKELERYALIKRVIGRELGQSFAQCNWVGVCAKSNACAPPAGNWKLSPSLRPSPASSTAFYKDCSKIQQHPCVTGDIPILRN